MKKQDFTLFWSVPPSQQDYANLMLSGVTRVMLTYQLASTKPDVLARLSGLGKHIIVRLEDDNAVPPADVAHALSDIRHILPIDAVITGNEPDGPFNMRYGSPDWGQQHAYASLPRQDALIAAIQGLGITAVSPAFSHPPDVISEDGPPMPGRTTYREIVAPTYQKADGCGLHLYALGWGFEEAPPDVRQVNRDRFKFALKWGVENWHRPVWADEVGIILASDVEKMRVYIDMADIVMRHRANERVMMFCPFISAGIPGGAWDARYLIKDQAAYALLAAWMSQ